MLGVLAGDDNDETHMQQDEEAVQGDADELLSS